LAPPSPNDSIPRERGSKEDLEKQEKTEGRQNSGETGRRRKRRKGEIENGGGR
jgi:hypothetical protein